MAASQGRHKMISLSETLLAEEYVHKKPCGEQNALWEVNKPVFGSFYLKYISYYRNVSRREVEDKKPLK